MAVHCSDDYRDCHVALLCQSTPVPDPTSLWGPSPLHLACRQGNYQMATTLLTYGFDVNAAEHLSGLAPVLTAAFRTVFDKYRVICALAEKGASLAAIVNDGRTLAAALFGNAGSSLSREGIGRLIDFVLEKLYNIHDTSVMLTYGLVDKLNTLRIAAKGEDIDRDMLSEALLTQDIVSAEILVVLGAGRGEELLAIASRVEAASFMYLYTNACERAGLSYECGSTTVWLPMVRELPSLPMRPDGLQTDRLQSKDVVALMDHLTVRDAHRNARDTEVLVTLVRSAAEMRNSFGEIKSFIRIKTLWSRRVRLQVVSKSWLLPILPERQYPVVRELQAQRAKMMFKRSVKGCSSERWQV